MNNIKIEKLQESLNKTESKVSKIETTIQKSFKQIEKKCKQLNYNLNVSDMKFGTLSVVFEGQKEFVKLSKKILELAQSDNDDWLILSEVESKLKSINSNYIKLSETLETVNNWESKIAKEEQILYGEIVAPKAIIEFLNNWEKLAIEWYTKNSENLSDEKIKKIVEREKQVKLINLTKRVEKITGNMLDAKGLQVSNKGDLVGIVVGEKGNAHIQSIVAGGWNIQCFHLRTLVNAC